MSVDFRVADWLIEPRLNAVSRDGTTVHLEPKVMAVLVSLAQHAGEPVSKEELLQAVWPDTFVTDDVLKRSVSELRRVFEDNARDPHVIQTIPKSGYRLIVPVEPVNGGEIAAPASVREEASKTLRYGRVLVVGFAALLLIFVAIGGSRVRERFGNKSSPPQIRSIAVLPLENLSHYPDQEYLSDGLTDALITELAQLGSLRVISRTSSMQYKQSKKSLPEIARELNVDGIVEGTVQRSGDRLRITAQLIYGPSDKHLWANSYERDVRDVFALERDLTLEIAQRIQAQLKTASEARFTQPRSVNANALEAYLQGNYYLNRYSEGELRKAEEYFQRAVDADPAFAAAYVGMAHARVGRFQASGEDAAIARRAAERGRQLDPTLSDAWVALGQIKLLAWDWPGVEEDYRKAIELNPNNALAHHDLGRFLDAQGRLDEGLKESQIAQQLDPNQDHLSVALDDRREFDRSIEINLMMLRKDPNNVVLHHNLYLNYEAKGMYKDAVLHLEQAWALGGFQEVAVNLHKAFASSGYRGAMRAYARELEHVHVTQQIFLPVNLAGIYATLGDRDRAFSWLEEAFKHGPGPGIPLWRMKLYSALEPLQSDPRFKDLVRRIGLPP